LGTRIAWGTDGRWWRWGDEAFWGLRSGGRQRQIQGSLHCATDDEAVRRFGRDDVLLHPRWMKCSDCGEVLGTQAGLGEAGAGHEEGVEGLLLEEGDLDADGDDLAGVGGAEEVLAAGAEVGESEMVGAGELEAGGDEAGVEVEDETELDLEGDLEAGGGDAVAVVNPAAAVDEDARKKGEEGVTLLVAIALDVE
jgi:hypothetical protein